VVLKKFCNVSELEIALEHPISELSREEIATLVDEHYAEYLGMVELDIGIEMSFPPKVILYDYTSEIISAIQLFYIKNDVWGKKLLYYSKIHQSKFQFHFSAQIKDLPCLHQD
jgi:hypothetical protein